VTSPGSHIKKRAVRLRTRVTSISVEDEFWQGLKEIARGRQLSLNKLVDEIIEQQTHANLSSGIRLYVLEHYRRLAERGRGW